MQNIPLDSFDQITPQWLTQVLREHGSLTRGSVAEVQILSRQSNWASNAVLQLIYSADALGERPARLFIKLCSPGAGTFGDSEVIYYTRVAPQIKDPPIPRCYHAAYDPDTGRYHLLLQDLSATHAPDIEPTWELASLTMVALAQLHAAWWNHAHMTSVGEFPDRSKIEKYTSYAARGLAPMLEEVGAGLPRDWPALIRKIFDRHPQKMIERVGNGKDITFIHGDLNPGNILSPIGADGKIYLIDHQPFDWSLSLWLGVSDLTYMMVHWWEPEMRRAWEKPLLEIYHRHLMASGVRDYSMTQLWADYRLCAMQSLYVPAAWCVNPADRQRAKGLWQSQLQKAMTACVDLQCLDLL